MKHPGLFLVIANLLVAARAEPPCCWDSAQNATALGPVIVLRRDEDRPDQGAAAAAMDPTWEATLRRATARALAGLGPGLGAPVAWDSLAEAPFISSKHESQSYDAFDEPNDIVVLARGLLFSNHDERLEFRESELPGEQCHLCPAQDLSRGTIRATWSVRRIRHSGPNADRRPCYELQFSVTPVVPRLPPLERWTPAQALLDWKSSVGAGVDRDLRPKGLILRVQATPHPLPDPLLYEEQAISRSGSVEPQTTTSITASPPSSTTKSNKVHQHLHHHFYMKDGLPVYAGSTTEKEYPSKKPFRPSPSYHQYSEPDPLYHSTRSPTAVGPPRTVFPNSINEQLPPVAMGVDTRVPYVAASVGHLRPTTVRFPETVTTSSRRPTVIATPIKITTPSMSQSPGRISTGPYPVGSQVYHITGEYAITTHNTVRPSEKIPLKAQKGKINPKGTRATFTSSEELTTQEYQTKSPRPTYYEIGTAKTTRATEPSVDKTTNRQTKGVIPVPTGTTSTNQITIQTPAYKDRNYEMTILNVMTSKVPSYIDILAENGTRVTTMRPYLYSTGSTATRENTKRLRGGEPQTIKTTQRIRNDATTIADFEEDNETKTRNKISTTLQTRRPHGLVDGGALTTVTKPYKYSTPQPPPKVTYFVAEEPSKLPSASTLVGAPTTSSEDTAKLQYAILQSVKQSIANMKLENNSTLEDNDPTVVPNLLTRRVSTESNGFNLLEGTPNSIHVADNEQFIVNGHTNHRNGKAYNPTTTSSTSTTTRRPWRPSTKRSSRQRSSYQQQFAKRRNASRTTTQSPVEPTSIVESRRTYSVSKIQRVKVPRPIKGNNKLQKPRVRERAYIAEEDVFRPNKETRNERTRKIKNPSLN